MRFHLLVYLERIHILSLRIRRDAAAALVGSLGLIPSINTGDSFVMGEPCVTYLPLLCDITSANVK